MSAATRSGHPSQRWFFVLRHGWPIGVLLFYSLLTLWLLWPYPLRAGDVVLHRGDPVHQLWTLRWVQHALAHDPTRLFAANTNYPYDAALTLNQPVYTNALLTAPVYALTRNQVLTYNAGVLLSFVLGGACTALLVQQVTGSRWAGLAAGVLYSFAPVRQAHMYHLNLISSYWTPLVLWGLHRLWRDHRSAPSQGGAERRGPSDSAFAVPAGRVRAWSGARSIALVLVIGLATAAQILAEFYHAIYLALAMGLFLLWQLVARRWGITWRGTALLAASGLLGLLLALPIVLTTARAWSELDLRRTIEDHDRYSARLENYLMTDRRMRIDYGLQRLKHFTYTRATDVAEHSLYPGLLALPLATAGLLLARRCGLRDAPLYLLIALAAFYFSLGPTVRVSEESAGVPSTLYRWLYAHVPGFHGARAPSRWAMLLQLALAVLAGYGIAGVAALGRARWWAHAVGGLCVGLLALDFWGPPIRGTTEPVGEPLPEVYRVLAAQPPGAVLEYPLTNANELLPVRYEYFSTFHWRPIVNSGSSIVPQAYVELEAALRSFPDRRAIVLLQGLGVRYVVVHRYEMSGFAAWWSRVLAAPGVRVLTRTADREDALLAIDPPGATAAMPNLTVERWTDASGTTRVLFDADMPLVIDRAHVYQRRWRMSVGIERASGQIVPMEAVLPTYLLDAVAAVPWPGLPADVVALHLPTAHGPVRVALRAPPAPVRPVEGPQLSGQPLPPSVAAGALLPCRVYGKGPLPIPGLVLSLNLVDASGQVRAKQDRFFDEGFAPPERWPARSSEPVPCDMPIPEDLPPGQYNFAIGLYDPASARFIPFADPEGRVGPYWSRTITVTSRHNES